MSVHNNAMRWEKVQHRGGSGGPGVRWGHTCNAIRGGKLLYVFGGYGKDQCQTNNIHVFDTVNMLWSEPVMKGIPPVPRDSHSCTTVGDNLFVFGGTDGRRPLNDLHILDTSTNTWILPSVRGDGPEPREGHSAALIGKRLFIFGGCGKSVNSEIYYDDLYILNTETFSWKCVVPSGTPPSKRVSHTCSSWKNKIIVIGGEDSNNYYLSDVHILDADTLVWCTLNTSGQLLPPRGGHTTVGFGKNLFVFGGFSDEQNLYDDVYMLDIESGAWMKVLAVGEGPSGRFSMAGESLDPQMGGVLVFIGGCNKNLEALDDIYLLHTGLFKELERDERRIEKLSLRKQLKLKCQEQSTFSPPYEKSSFGSELDHDNTVYQPMPISTYVPSVTGRQNFYLNEYQTPMGKRTFQAKVTKSFTGGYTIETIIDGRPLRGVLFSNKPSFGGIGIDVSNRKVEIEKSMKNHLDDVKQTDNAPKENEVVEAQLEVAASEMKNLAVSGNSVPVEVSSISKPDMAPDVNAGNNAVANPSSSDADIHTQSVSTVMDQNAPFH
ncbi:Galactose oxidase/kelch repeat superfamily protein [Striga hermonthica]|uniref:Galactose oxidase/kelch repeat superfamily protein n=1 Tax=Striga hermonthica TaxID=68872 RepID=A0A9N7N437_STRHE|nr:Galactose oxidase/kelch repeat superfamily protein [Striga hermonthica]